MQKQERKEATTCNTSKADSAASPLWRRMLRDRKAVAFIKRHTAELSPNGYKEDYRILKNNPSLINAQVKQIIEDGRPYVQPELEDIAALYSSTPAREISRRLKLPIKLIYSRIQRLRRTALEQFRAREVEEKGAPLGVTTPPVKTLRFRLNEREQVVTLVAKDGELLWVDEGGRPFGEEIQDLLNHRELLSDFEVLDAEEV